MKKSNYKFKVKEVNVLWSGKEYLVYYNSKDKPVLCRTDSIISATNICMLLNRQLEQGEAFFFSVHEYDQCFDGH